MSVPAYPSTIPPDAVDLKFSPPGYSADFANIVGNAVTATDGWDALYNAFASSAGIGPSFTGGLDTSISALVANGDPANLPWEADFQTSLANTITQGSPDFEAYATHLAPANPTAPTPAPTTTTTYKLKITINSNEPAYVNVVCLDAEVVR